MKLETWNLKLYLSPMQPRIIVSPEKFAFTLERLCRQLIETHGDFSNSAIIGVQPRGVLLAKRLHKRLCELLKKDITFGNIDPTFYRDDFRSSGQQLAPSETDIDFIVEGKKVILVDDVLYTGRTIRAAMDALLDFGRAEKVELLVLVDRRFTRHLPIQPDYVGKTIDSISSEKVKVEWKEKDGNDKIWIVPKTE